MDTKIRKILMVTGSIALTVVAFYFVPKINKKIADRLYRKMQ